MNTTTFITIVGAIAAALSAIYGFLTNTGGN